MNSPIRTAIVNNTDKARAVTCVPRRRIIINPKSECVIDGDIFSLCENMRSVNTLLEQISAGVIAIYFIVDGAFEVKTSHDVLSISSATRAAVSGKDKLSEIEADELTKQEASDNQEKLSEESKKEERAKQEEKLSEESKKEEQPKTDEELKLEELKITEPAKQEDKPAEEPKKEEQAKQEEKLSEESKAEEPKKSEDKPKTVKKVQVK